MKKKIKVEYFSNCAKKPNLLSKIIIVILVIGMFLSHINISSIIALTKGKDIINNNVINTKIEDLNTLEEDITSRTLNSKTYIKDNGIYETIIYNEPIHYLKNNKYQDIDNSLILNNSYYINKANKYTLSLPKELKEKNKINLKYLDNELNLYYDISSRNTILNETNKNNLNDKITYIINDNEKIEYQLLQNKIKENVILNSYISNYSYSYFIETSLRLVKLNNNIHFYNDKDLIFKMNEYVMIDNLNSTSY